MFEFEVVQEIKPSSAILEIIKDCIFTIYMELIKAHFYADAIINCPYMKNGNIIDNLTLISKMDSFEQNKVALYLFNSINWKMKKYIKDDKILDNYKQMF